MTFAAARFVYATALLSACASTEPAPAEETPEQEACEHLGGSLATAVTAVDDKAPGQAPDVSKAHTKFTVTLPADASGTYAGTVRFLAPAKGQYLVVADAAVPFALLDSGGKALDPVAGATKAACAAVAAQAVYALDVATYRLKLGPAPKATVSVLFEAK